MTRPLDPAVAVAATFTAEPLEDVLKFWFRHLGWAFSVQFAPYNQVFQQLLDPGSLLARNREGFNVVLLRLEDWIRDRKPDSHELQADAERFLAALEGAARTFSSPILVGLCPSSPAFAESVQEMENRLAEAIRQTPAIHSFTPGELAALYPATSVHDPHADQLGHIPYTDEYFAALGTMIARRLHALRTPPWKVIALDCDDTLWSGIIGEDGPEGIRLDPPRRALQEFMRAQKDAGMLLVIVSRNNDEDVVEAFRAHPEMPLRLEDFVARRANWESKGANLASLAQELGLGLDTFLFVDDNHKECLEVRSFCPEVVTVPLPADPDSIPQFLRHFWPFDRVRVTEEDRRRTELYRQQLEHARLRRSAAGLEEFLRELQLEVEIAPLREQDLPRVAQLTQRTNQMNLSVVRRNESQVREALQEGLSCLTVRVRDRFGDYGLTGLAMFRPAGESLLVESFLLSCRVLGRGVEHRLLAHLGNLARRQDLAFVDLVFVPARRNDPARRFLEGLPVQERRETADGLVYRLLAEDAAAVAYRPQDASAPEPEPAAAPVAGDRRPEVDYVGIAELREPVRILAEIRRPAQLHMTPDSDRAAPRTDLESELASLWAGLLKVPSVGIHDNFFDLGGHSLLVVQMLARVRERYGVDLSFEIVYSGDFTVAELARAIEIKRLEETGAQVEDLLREIESLSDEEVRALLAHEGGQEPAG